MSNAKAQQSRERRAEDIIKPLNPFEAGGMLTLFWNDTGPRLARKRAQIALIPEKRARCRGARGEGGG